MGLELNCFEDLICLNHGLSASYISSSNNAPENGALSESAAFEIRLNSDNPSLNCSALVMFNWAALRSRHRELLS
jgi:hypothetical protein